MALVGLIFATKPASAEQPALRAVSAVEYEPHEILFEPAGAGGPERKSVRIRLVAPQLADRENFGFEVIEADLQALCDSEGLRIVAESAPNAREVIVSVASDRVPFGETAPNVVQYFDVFSVDRDTCIWVGL